MLNSSSNLPHPPGTRFTERLRLEPIARRHTDDLLRLHADEDVAKWYAWSENQVSEFARVGEKAWRHHGVFKWMAYERVTGELVGRGGLSRLAPDSQGARQIAGLVPGWAPGCLEIGWAIRAEFARIGLATELAQAALTLAFDELGASKVIAFTEVHNARSRALAERLGMRYAGEIIGEGLVEGSDDVRPDARFAVYAINARTWAARLLDGR